MDLTNDCDLKYKSSKNQRLLVELTLMKLASIDFEGEKKNPESLVLANKTIDFIAPASFYRERPITNTGTKNDPGPKEAPPVESNGINANDTKESLSPEQQIQTEDVNGTSEGVIACHGEQNQYPERC